MPLELDGRHAGGLAGDQVGGPEPDEQRRVAALHNRADGQSCLTPAFAACQHARAGRNAERFASHTTVRTDEAVSPARLFEVFSAGGIVREKPLKLRQRLRKRQRGVLVDVHQNRRGRIHTRIHFSGNRVQGSGAKGERAQAHEKILALAGVCVNRIGKLRTTTLSRKATSRP